MNNLRTCNNCGWVHYGVSIANAKAEVAKFNDYYFSLSDKDRNDWYGGRASSLTNYMSCFNCGGHYGDFRESKQDDCPAGCTIQSILLPS